MRYIDELVESGQYRKALHVLENVLEQDDDIIHKSNELKKTIGESDRNNIHTWITIVLVAISTVLIIIGAWAASVYWRFIISG